MLTSCGILVARLLDRAGTSGRSNRPIYSQDVPARGLACQVGSRFRFLCLH
jgi:hypothetical protein